MSFKIGFKYLNCLMSAGRLLQRNRNDRKRPCSQLTSTMGQTLVSWKQITCDGIKFWRRSDRYGRAQSSNIVKWFWWWLISLFSFSTVYQTMWFTSVIHLCVHTYKGCGDIPVMIITCDILKIKYWYHINNTHMIVSCK